MARLFLIATMMLAWTSGADAQKAEAPESRAAATPAPQPTQTGLTAVGLPLPLRDQESLVPEGNGCAMLQPSAADAASLAAMRKFTWYGACRFGLIDGAGINRSTDSTHDFYSETRFRYGISLNGPGVSWYKSKNSWIRSDFEQYTAPGRPESLFFSDWSDSPYQLTSDGLPADSRSITLTTGPIASRYSDDIAFCSGGTASATSLLPADEQGAATSICANDKWSRFHTISYEKWATRSATDVIPDRNIQYLEKRKYLCASMSDCKLAWNKALAGQWQDIQRIKAELIAAQAAYVAELETRMAPLEAAYSARLARFAAAHRPAAKPKPKARKTR